MTTILISAMIFIIMFIAMAVGVVFGRSPIQGSCGGLGNKCNSCSRPCKKGKQAL